MENTQICLGTCLCKKVSIKAIVPRQTFAACHCGMCRKWSGASALAVEVNKEIKFTGEEYIQVYSSSEWAERGFCKNCGTHLFYRTKDGSYQNVPLGILENADLLKFNLQIFIDKKPQNYSFANTTDCMTEAEVFAKYAP